IVQSLDDGIPIVIGLSLSDAFFSPGTDGIITAREPVDRHRRHAVIGVGHGKQGQELFVLVRNSWGSAWGNNGYAWVSQDYMEPRLTQVAELREDLT
ncbi:MAG: C1 family peptidase, partial [Nitrososphaerales archaeon]